MTDEYSRPPREMTFNEIEFWEKVYLQRTDLDQIDRAMMADVAVVARRHRTDELGHRPVDGVIGQGLGENQFVGTKDQMRARYR